MSAKQKNEYWLRSGLLTLLQNIVGIGFGFGSFFILVRILEKENYGAWTLFLGTITLLEFIRNGLIQSALIKFLSSAKEEDKPAIVSASFLISGILTIACILINISFAQLLCNIWHAPQLAPLFHLYNVVFLISGVLTQLACIEQANFSYKGIFISNFIRQGFLFFYVIFCFFFKVKLELTSLVYVQIFSVLTSTITEYFFTRRYLSFVFTVNKEWVKKLFNYGKFSFGTTLGSMIFNSIDQWMLGAYLSPAAAGAYNIAVRITNLVEIPTTAVSTIVFPQSARRMETEGKDAIKYLYEKSVGTIMAILIPGLLILFFFSDFVVNLIAGGKYDEAIPILRVTVLYCLLIPYGRQFGTILDSIGKPKITFTIVVISACINVVLNYLFINWYGVIGAAYGTLTANLIGFVIGQAILRKELQVNLGNTFTYAWQFYPEFLNKYLRFR